MITIEQFKEVFGKTAAWIELWPNVEKLLKLPEFKFQVCKEDKALEGKDERINYISKIEVGILACLWCQSKGGTKCKAAYL
jgi:hypothetical protein